MSPRRLFTLVAVVLLGCGRSPQRNWERGIEYFKEQKFSQAVGCFEKALAKAPPTPQALNLLGVCQLQDGKTDDAIHNFQEALTLDPGNAAARYNLDRKSVV